jgi:hypothetical protein
MGFEREMVQNKKGSLVGGKGKLFANKQTTLVLNNFLQSATEITISYCIFSRRC